MVRAERVMTGGVTHRVDFFKQDHSVPVRAPPTEAPGMELDESSGHQSSTETSQDTKGQDQSALSVPFTVPLSSLNTCLSFSLLSDHVTSSACICIRACGDLWVFAASALSFRLSGSEDGGLDLTEAERRTVSE